MVEVYKWMKGYIKWGNNRVVNIQYQCKKKKLKNGCKLDKFTFRKDLSKYRTGWEIWLIILTN